METSFVTRVPLRRLMLVAALAYILPLPVQANFTEPSLVIDGRVLNLDEGAARPLFSGTLSMTLVRVDDPSHSVTRSTQLAQIGGEGGLSYRLEFPQRYLPEDRQLPDHLETGPGEIEYRIESVTVDGASASALDSARSLVTLGFGNRAPLHRLDLVVSLPMDDSDGDGMPDWWEEDNGLNPNLAGDATSDVDGDGLDALTEYRLGTDPNSSNDSPVIQTVSLLVPAGGTAGLYLKVVDADDAPEDVSITIDSIPSGLTLVSSSSGTLSEGDSFSHADLLAGTLTLKVERGFGTGILGLTVTDSQVPAVPYAATIVVSTYQPADRQPVMWLDAEELADVASAGPVLEWPDASGYLRDGYQPFAAEAPVFDASIPNRLAFDGESFFYLDDRGLLLTDFTALVRFDVDEFDSEDQSILTIGGMTLQVGGTQNLQAAESCFVIHNGRKVLGAHLPSSEPGQFTVSRKGSRLALGHRAADYFPSITSTATTGSAFPTLGGKRLLTSTTATNRLHGAVREVLMFDRALEPGERTRAEESQQSRWDDLVVWDYRDEAITLEITGSADLCNAISGGWGDDSITGGNDDDVLRGGPGSDHLTGGPGADRFHILADHGDDLIRDFSEAEGDALDLTDIFGGFGGLPEDYLSFRIEIVRDANNVPQVQSILQLDHNGDGVGTDQEVTFVGLALSDLDLPRLVGQGSIRLGGAVHPVSISLAAATTQLTETEVPRTVTVSREGNLAAALTVRLACTGSATPGADYSVGNAVGAGAVWSVTFEAGASTADFTITPIMDDVSESETIALTVFDDGLVTSVPATPLLLSLSDAPAVQLTTTSHAIAAPITAGTVLLSRTGDATDPLTVELAFSGSALNGDDFSTLATSQTFPAGSSTVELDVLPTGNTPPSELPAVAWITVVENTGSYQTIQPGTTEVQILATAADLAPDFEEWRGLHFAGDLRSDDELLAADDDGNGIPNGFSYLRGTDPTANEAGESPVLAITRTSDGYLELSMEMIPGILDVTTMLETSTRLDEWTNADAVFIREASVLANGNILRTYRSKSPLSELGDSGFFRPYLEFVEAPVSP